MDLDFDTWTLVPGLVTWTLGPDKHKFRLDGCLDPDTWTWKWESEFLYFDGSLVTWAWVTSVNTPLGTSAPSLGSKHAPETTSKTAPTPEPTPILIYPHLHLPFLCSTCNDVSCFHPSIHIQFRLGCCPCPILWDWQHQAMWNTGSPYISDLRVNGSQATNTNTGLCTFKLS